MPVRKTNSRTQSAASLVRKNLRIGRLLSGDSLSLLQRSQLKKLSREHGLALESGELVLLEGRWYVTSAGLLRLARESGCKGIHTNAIKQLCVPQDRRWVFRATVYKAIGGRGFVGYGDADPSNVSSLVRGAEMRVAETRAVNRALRKAYGIGLCSVEELGSFSAPQKPIAAAPHSNGPNGSGRSSNGQPKLRDQLCLLIRQHNLDPALVKTYAADFCGTQTIKDASRDLVESFIAHISTSAKEDLDGLICKLNSYSRPAEVSQ